MPISANVTNRPITASVSETQIDVSVGSPQVTASVSGGFGPSGVHGSSGVVTVSAPITNSGTASAANIGLAVGAGLSTVGGALVVSYGTTAGTACQGNDARLSDARTPLSHTHTASQITDFTTAVIAAAPPTTNASLLTSGTLPDARLSSNIARTTDVSSAVAALVNSAPATLDTLNELAAALGNDASFATTVTNSLAGKAPTSHSHDASAINAGTLAADRLPLASANTRGAVRIGTGVSVDGNGVISVSIPSLDWASITGKPSTFAPSAHNHTASDITSGTLSASLLPTSGVAAGTYTSVTVDTYGRVTAGSSPSIAYSALTGLPTLGSAAAASTSDFAAASHSHAASAITSGTLDAARLPLATASVAGAVIVGSGLNVSSGTLSVASTTRLSDTVSNVSYIGLAPAGSATSANVWRIKRTTIATNGTVSSSVTATNVAWNDRLTASYS